MENERFYRGVFYAGSGWNFLASIPTAFLIGTLPAAIQIEVPHYPIFIYFNLMTVFMFGCMQFAVARHLSVSRPFVKILVWSKMLAVLIFIAAIVFLVMPTNLTGFLAPGIFVDLVFGALFWRYLVFSANKMADKSAKEHSE